MVILNVILFFLFALIGSLEFRKKKERSLWGASISVIVAESFGFSQRLASMMTFIVSFYLAMQGMAVSVYTVLWYFFGNEPQGWLALYSLPLEISGLIMFLVGGLLVILGWSKVFKNRKNLVTDGIYNYIRHPQYTGILLATLGLVVYRFSPISALLWPVLVVIYYRLARKEEREIEAELGEKYLDYKHRVSMFFPLTILRRNQD